MIERARARKTGGSRPTGATSAAGQSGVARSLIAGFATVGFVFAGLGGWAATAPIAGAVVTPGTVVVSSNVKPVQHPTGGVVSAIEVKNGDRVKAGDVLIFLDETVLRANLALIDQQIDERRAEIYRLTAERDGRAAIENGEAILARAGLPHVRASLDGEMRLFESRNSAHRSLIEQLRERIAQLGEEASGIDGQIAAKASEVLLIAEELSGLKPLEEKRLVTTNRMAALRREAARLAGEQAQLKANAARVRGQVAELEIHILQREQERRTEIVTALRSAQSRLNELVERQVAAADELKRVEIRAPQDGFVHQLRVHAPGAVIGAREPVLTIVPDKDDLVIEAQIAPGEIDRVAVGSKASIRFSSFNQQTTPLVSGTVVHVSADLARGDASDRQTPGALTAYVARITLDSEELARLDGAQIKPGMPADIQITTDERTALSYLVKPFTDQMSRAFRER